MFSSTSAALIIGNSDNAIHMTFDNDEILVKSNSNTAGTLKLQEGGGTVQVGESRSITSTLNVFGKVQEGGSDLVPQGVIVMWSGALSNIPSGWALCDGRRYQINATTGLNDTLTTGGVLSPDLTSRFVVGAGTAYGAGDTGGQDSVKLKDTECALPSHTHSMNHGHGVTDPGHSHGIRAPDSGSGCGRIPQDDDDCASPPNINTESATTGLTVNNFTGPTGSANQTSATNKHENRPPYYALAFIIKL